MRLSAHLLAPAWAAGLATAETSVPMECRNSDISLNATNVDVAANCTLYSYQCVGDPALIFVTTPLPPANCTVKTGYIVYFRDYNMTEPSGLAHGRVQATLPSGLLYTGKFNALSFPALNSSRSINITSTGDLDCVAFAATVANTTIWATYIEHAESLECTSNKYSIKTHPVPAEDTSGGSGFSGFHGNLLFLAGLVGSMRLVNQ
ncbi:hypothetical protein V496_03148 [Pseudogymnoascus sp. VKM F-4515 (FW-2607)]|nr:hypothetical protein V496_03148 [Pseudogymnoascus sp. VKM F-4515 (FW-2607)]